MKSNLDEHQFRFNVWWMDEGLDIAADNSTSVKRIKMLCRTAWLNGAYVENEMKEVNNDEN